MADANDLRGHMAVVTGASSGIGLCFCRTLAARGCGLVMISNQKEQLDQCAAAIASESGVEAIPLFCDLTCDDAAEKIIGFIDSRGLDPDILINNAGIFSFLPVTDTSARRLECFISLHVSAVTMLSRAFADRFIRRGGGRILNMSSMSCWMPMPGLAMYAATKSYIRVFSRSLHYETRESGVTVTVACPGGIATDLFGLPRNLQRLALRLGVLQSPEKFTRNAVRKMLKGRKQYINGWLNRLSIVFVASLPTRVRMAVKHRMLDKNITRP
ncbi:MAG: SDR family NAD(P)-dependent oxidoreductase [Muribaculaceae bacterium]|nr:SDR family NAD(P)-dependent oxidoreductase [Muribaculaceae bacterium]